MRLVLRSLPLQCTDGQKEEREYMGKGKEKEERKKTLWQVEERIKKI
ncbi:hypothetical protein D082_31840 [Synechocystis sp. PCC 6714]|nr:hypothetical protein D082_31840 [Synechocystis sp. PCC 6714]